MNNVLEQWRNGLIVSCQATAGSPLAKPEIIAAFAETAAQNGAVGVRIDSPENIAAVKNRISLPVLGIYKVQNQASEVYITPTFDAARRIAEAGADILAVDSTRRPRPNNETLEKLATNIRENLKKPIAADVATFDEGVYCAESLGFDVVITTLAGYTAETKHITGPDFDLLEKLAARLKIPVICEGRLSSAADARRAFDCGAHAIVVGNAITGIDRLVQQFVSATPGQKEVQSSGFKV